jgi:hypothetical protein
MIELQAKHQVLRFSGSLAKGSRAPFPQHDTGIVGLRVVLGRADLRALAELR